MLVLAVSGAGEFSQKYLIIFAVTPLAKLTSRRPYKSCSIRLFPPRKDLKRVEVRFARGLALKMPHYQSYTDTGEKTFVSRH